MDFSIKKKKNNLKFLEVTAYDFNNQFKSIY